MLFSVGIANAGGLPAVLRRQGSGDRSQWRAFRAAARERSLQVHLCSSSFRSVLAFFFGGLLQSCKGKLPTTLWHREILGTPRYPHTLEDQKRFPERSYTPYPYT